MRGALIHLDKRRRVHQKLEKYPHRNPKIKFLDNLVMVCAFIYPLTSIPQIYAVWINKNVAGISLTTWILYSIFALPFIVYSFVHKIRPYKVSGILWFCVYISIVIGTILYS